MLSVRSTLAESVMDIGRLNLKHLEIGLYCDYRQVLTLHLKASYSSKTKQKRLERILDILSATLTANGRGLICGVDELNPPIIFRPLMKLR